jgi:hypothetical protein
MREAIAIVEGNTKREGSLIWHNISGSGVKIRYEHAGSLPEFQWNTGCPSNLERKTMNELIKLAESIGELAKLPDTTKELIQAQHNVINTQSARIQNLENRLVGIMSKDDVKSITVSVMEKFLKDIKPQSDQDEYTFLIDHANPDKSLEEAIRKGQELQQSFWEEGEEIFTAEFGPSPAGKGWYGSTHMPVITLLFSGSEYRFHNTIRIPGRFQMKSVTRWGPAIRTLGDGDKVLRVESIFGWNPCVGHPIGIYTEPATELSSGMIVRPFEQEIRYSMIVAHNNSVPVYLAQNPDRLQIVNNNIQSHQGSNIGIFHGPHIDADWMPKSARSGDDVYLGDSTINHNQIEGPHRMEHNGSRKQAGIFFSGQAVQTCFNRFFGYSQCIYSHGGRSRVSMGNQAYAKPTADGRVWARVSELVGTTFCIPTANKPEEDEIHPTVGAFYNDIKVGKGIVVQKRAGWHNAGEAFL